ncbi:FtsK/SpoIIIE domain-containing protein [Streptomyces sp. NPDC094466]|uniref:FtsK/SpoIIIE domain-containing protein n=1 Tax=Streptomyces sp. NPDC094466 TaxID=3366065 RepID=UPI003823F411
MSAVPFRFDMAAPITVGGLSGLVDDATGYLPLLAVFLGSVFAVWGVVWVVRYLLADTAHRASIRQAVRIRFRWKRLAPMLKLASTDKTPTLMASLSSSEGKQPKPRTLVPTLKVRHDAFGVIARARCLPGVGLEEYQKAAPYLADAWGCTRVAVTQDTPGHVVVRGVRLDPLTTPTRHRPSGRAPDAAARWDLGVDEYAQPVTVDLTQVPGVTVAGLPGSGKTSLINRLMSDWAPSSAVQFACADGKVTTAHEGDYAHLVERMFAFVGDDLDDANTLFKRLVKLRRARVAAAGAMLGTNDMWQVGPSQSWPLVVLIIDEAHTYFRDHRGSDKETKRLAALAAENARLVEDLVKKGRSMGILVILATQKSTGDAIPTFIRDVCPIGLSFAQKTSDAAVAALGEDIRNWPDADPVNLQGPAYVGVASMNHPTRPGFLRIRTPLVTGDDSATIAHQTAHLTQDPATLLPQAPDRIGLDKTPPDEESGPLAA